MDNYTQFYIDLVQNSFVNSLYRRASDATANEYAERMTELFSITESGSIGELNARYQDLVYSAANVGVDISEIVGNEAVLDFFQQARTDLARGATARGGEQGTISPASEKVKTGLNNIIGEIITKGIQSSQEAFNKRYALQEMRINVGASTRGKFDYQKYYALNEDIGEAYTATYGVESESAREFFALKHYSLFGEEEGRQYTEALPEEPSDIVEPEQPTPPSFNFSGAGGIDFSGLYTSVASQEASNNALADQLSSYISAIANQPTEELPVVDVPETADIVQGNVLQLVSTERQDRGLNPYIGFQDTRGQTYLQSIRSTGRQSTINRTL